MAPHYILRSAPPQRHVGDGVCRNLGTTHRPHYHGGGWLPVVITTKTCVLTPGIFAPKGTWGIRPLTVREYLACKDVPEQIIRELGDAPLLGPNAMLETLVPGKCLEAGFFLFNREYSISVWQDKM
jgi:hypothetical protein